MCGKFNFIKTAKLFPSGFTTVYFHQQYMRGPVAWHPRQHLVLSIYFILAIPVGLWWHLFMVLVCAFLMTTEAEHPFMYFLVISMSFTKCLGFLLYCLSYWIMSSSYIIHLVTSSLSDMSIANIFLWLAFSFYYHYFLICCQL